ncbi:MAG: polysaccharide biosynthesis/export family protein [Chthoniobacteraceae bacterium]
MNLRPKLSPGQPRPGWLCGAVLLLLSLHGVTAPPSLARSDSPAGIDNRAASPQVLGTNTAAFTTSMEVLNDTLKLNAGDHVSLRILEEKHEPYNLVVGDGGDMEIPHIGRVQAVDKTCKQLAYEIKPLFEKDYFVKATVIIGVDLIGTKSRGKVYLTGQVRSPGVLELMPGDPMTVSQAILRANGVGDFADKRNIRLVRRKDGIPVATAEMLKSTQPKKDNVWKNIGKVFSRKKEAPNNSTETFIVDLVDILEKGHLERDPILKVGDLIYVPERLINY